MKSQLKSKKSQQDLEQRFSSLRVDVTNVLKRFNLLDRRKTAVVGVSGGVDSMVLLDMLASISIAKRPNLVIAHVNHRTRGKESDRDQVFVEAQARRFGFPCMVKKLAISVNKKNGSLEDTWRRARREFFIEVCKRVKAEAVILAHHGDDQIETVLMRIMRGTGLHGLSSIHERIQEDGISFIRPLLAVSRSELMSYAQAMNVPYVHDSSNDSPEFLRNRIRHRLIPYLEAEFGPNVKPSLGRLAKIAFDESDFLHAYVRRVWPALLTFSTRDVMAFQFERLRSEHPAVRFYILRQAILKLAGVRQVDFEHNLKFQSFFEAGQGGAFHLPHGVLVKKERSELVFYRRGKENSPGNSNFEYAFLKCGTVEIVECGLAIGIRRISSQKAKKSAIRDNADRWREIIDFDRLTFPLRVRSRKEGDQFCPLGQRHNVNLKDFFARERFPVYKKTIWPLLISGGHIIWVPGSRISDFVKVTDGTKRFAELSAGSPHLVKPTVF